MKKKEEIDYKRKINQLFVIDDIEVDDKMIENSIKIALIYFDLFLALKEIRDSNPSKYPRTSLFF